MNVVVIYRQLDGCLGWLVVRELFVGAAKQTCRLQGTPAIAVIRFKQKQRDSDYG